MIIGHPGTWQQFQFRPDNKGLNVMEMKSKYLHEQYLFEAQMLNLQQMQQQNPFMNGVGGGGPLPSSEPPGPTYATEVQFYFIGGRSAVENELTWDPTQLENWNTTVFGTSDRDPFEVIEVTAGESDLLVTLKGNYDNLAVLGDDVFNSKTLLVRVQDINGNCISTVGGNCFTDCVNLTDVSLDAVIGMGAEAFNGCVSLDTISFNSLSIIPDASADSLEYGVFNSCPLSSLDFIGHFSSLEEIGSYVFYNTGFRDVTFENNLVIGKRAFAESAVINLSINATVNFGDRSFAQSQLQTINLPFNNIFYDGSVFDSVPEFGEAFVNVNDETEQAILNLEAVYNWIINP